MNVNAVGNMLLANQMQSTKNSQQSLTTNSLKNAMDSPQQFLQLLEQSVAVKNTIDIANGIGINVDTKV